MNIILKDEDYEKKKEKLVQAWSNRKYRKKYVISKYDTPL